MATSNDQLFRPMRWRGISSDHPAPNCPRCASQHTKFCYYNNYSLSQPRYFCKACRRYWTKGGSLRNVPVGGGCRKTRRSRSNKTGSSHLDGLGPKRPTPIDSSDSSSGSGGPNIDLALVFANFLNHQQQDDININNNSNNNSNNVTVTPVDKRVIQEEEEEEEQGLFMISPELASFDDVIDDVFWSDIESNFSSFTDPQDFDSPPLLTVDQFKGSSTTNPLISCENWSFFDTTGFEVFSKPYVQS